MRFRITNFSRPEYSRLLQGPRYARIRAVFPGSRRETLLYGDIKWIDYRSNADPPECHIGVRFTQLFGPARAALDGALAALDGQSPPIAAG